MNVMLKHNGDMVEAGRDLDYGSHQTSDREKNGPVKVKEEKDPLSSAFIEWETEEEEREEEEVSHVCTSLYYGPDVCDVLSVQIDHKH
jgi:hypothetical protein